jgi:FkbM family methyltransferase
MSAAAADATAAGISSIRIARKEKVLSILNLILYRIRLLLAIKRTFTNYKEVIGNIRNNRYPFYAYLRCNRDSDRNSPSSGDNDDYYDSSSGVVVGNSSNKVMIRSFQACYFLINARNAPQIDYYDLDRDVVECILDDGKSKVTLKKGISDGDVSSIYIHDEYSYLPVKDRVVVDIGANIADSAIYFCAKGAKKIVALEPFPYTYKIAVRNIATNNMQDRIIMVNAGCFDPSSLYYKSNIRNGAAGGSNGRGRRDGGDNDDVGGSSNSSSNNSIIIDPNFASNSGSVLHMHTQGVEVPLYSLAQIISKYDIDSDAILKVDCEGCEYDIMLLSPGMVLRQFAYIQIEYHHGYSLLKKRLEGLGFEVQVSSPRRALNHNTGTVIHVGWLYARRLPLST